MIEQYFKDLIVPPPSSKITAPFSAGGFLLLATFPRSGVSPDVLQLAYESDVRKHP